MMLKKCELDGYFERSRCFDKKQGQSSSSVVFLHSSVYPTTGSLCSVRQKSQPGSRASACLCHMTRPASAASPLGSCEERFTGGLATVAMVTEALPSNTCGTLVFGGESTNERDALTD